MPSEDQLSVSGARKPRLLFLRKHGNVPNFIRSHLQQHVRCLETFFDVRVVSEQSDYNELCESFQPDLTLVDSGIYGRPPEVANKLAHPEVPKLGFLHADAYCSTRSNFLSDMENWGIATYFTMSVSMPDYMPTVADRLFIWPNCVDPEIYRDYALPKIIPVLTTGSQAMHYPWRNRINKIVAHHFPSLVCPHFGWSDVEKTARMIYDEQYARLINASYVVPTCGTIAREVVRKHFEIPGANSCLVTERTPALEDAGFIDMQNCVFVTEADVIDKLDYLFANRDVLRQISVAGHVLVHSHHTIAQRDQIFQWFTLNKCRQSNQRIIQSRPFGPLAIVSAESRERNHQYASNSVDRAILKQGYEQLQLGNYGEAERRFLSCLNYHRMPEPFLGLALVNLKKGDPASAVRWISESIPSGLGVDKTVEPDPVEFAYLVIAQLCRGDVPEAAKLARQFPLLRHQELDRCRAVLEALTHSENPIFQPATQKSRPSIHQLPQRDVATWLDELCQMLVACRQPQLAERLQVVFREDLAEKIFPICRREPARGMHTAFASSDPIVPLSPESLSARVRRRIPPKLWASLANLRAKIKRKDEFASAVSTWARGDQGSSALVLGPSHQSPCTRAFLEGIQKNPLMPTVLCVGPATDDFKKLQGRFAGNPRIKFSSGSVQTAKVEAALESFDLVLIDRCAASETETLEAISGAKTILLRDIGMRSGYGIASGLLKDEYRVVDDVWSDVGHSAIFTKTPRNVC